MVLGLAGVFILIDRLIDVPSDPPEIIPGIVTEVYIAIPRYSPAEQRCRVRLPDDFFIDGSCYGVQIGDTVRVCKTIRRYSRWTTFKVC